LQGFIDDPQVELAGADIIRNTRLLSELSIHLDAVRAKWLRHQPMGARRSTEARATETTALPPGC
jgi:hypothetical protein